jgi:hypothetical protein
LQTALSDSRWRHAVATAARAHVREHHNLAQTVDAWQKAVAVALHNRAAAGALVPGLAWRLQDMLAVLVEGAALRLRQFNRARLARRQQRRR